MRGCCCFTVVYVQFRGNSAEHCTGCQAVLVWGQNRKNGINPLIELSARKQISIFSKMCIFQTTPAMTSVADLSDMSEPLFVCAPSALSLCYRHPTQASLKVTTRCCGSAGNFQTLCTTMGESASTLTDQMRPLLSMATWRSWGPWCTPLTSGPKKMSRRSEWPSVCLYECARISKLSVCVAVCLMCL